MGEPVADVTKRISQLYVSSKPCKVRGRGGRSGKPSGALAGRRISDAERFKYRWCRWPEVVGMEADEATRVIKQGKPDLFVSVVPQGQLMTMCYCTRRVRLIVDERNRVLRVPKVG